MEPSNLRLLTHEFYYDTLVFVRNRQSMFFTLGLPVIFLVLFASVFGSHTVRVAGGVIDLSVYYVPSLIALGIVAAAFVNLVVSITAAREAGIYKRRRATPVPAAVVIGGRSPTAVATALLTTVLLMAVGAIAYGATIPIQALPALALDVVAGTLAFCALGFALSGVIRDADSVQPVTQAIVLPLYFISGIFISSALIPGWLTRIANFFPIRHLAQALLRAYNPAAGTSGFAWHDLGSVTVWGAARPVDRAAPLHPAAALARMLRRRDDTSPATAIAREGTIIPGQTLRMTNQQNPGPQAPAAGAIRRRLLPALLYAAVVPYVVYRVATEHFHFPPVDALLLAAVSPAIAAVVGVVRARRPDAFSLLSLAGIAAKVVAALLFRDPRLVLISDSLLSGVYGVVLLGSALVGRPLLAVLAAHMTAAAPEQHAQIVQRLQSSGARRHLMAVTVIWGAGLLLIPAVSVLLTFTLPIATVVLVRPLVDYSIIGALLAVTFAYGWYTRRRFAKLPPAGQDG